ncbi:MAG TPA: RNase A-like domain-containing protein [Pseudacidobacterium sp.]|jgi:hypothetical protein|nr:RNase A-like domain-containing protein [Pseudacidobacterium sp.]
MDQDEEGLRLILSPVQLEAVLQHGQISPAEIAMNRVWGGVELLGGALELAFGVALVGAPEPTMLTKVGGGVLLVHGTDTFKTGFDQMWTGQPQKTLTAQAATAVAHDLGANPNQAELAGTIVDTAVPLFAATVVAAERIIAVRAGRIVLRETATAAEPGVNLAEEEAAGGHTIAKHVGQTEAQLRARLAAEPWIPGASSFRSVQEAQEIISKALQTNDPMIRTWASDSGASGKLIFEYSSSKPTGYGVVRSTGAMTQMNKINVVLRKTNIAGKIYFLLTSYPIP